MPWQDTGVKKYMSKFSEAFKNKAFVGFLTAGDPDIETSGEYILEMVRSGADIIEIGIPFSDPIAEGEVIQASTQRALKNGVNLDKVFSLVSQIRKETQVPVVFLTYLNPIFNYGYELFFAMCQKIGVQGVIIPDLPYEEKEEVQISADKYEIDLIPIIAPTSAKRIQKIACCANGFIYVISPGDSWSTNSANMAQLKDIVKEIKKVSDAPVVIGFGEPEEAEIKEAAKFCDGISAGSGIVRIIAQYGKNAAEKVRDYVKSAKKALK